MTPLLTAGLTFCLLSAALLVFPRMQLLDFPERYGLLRKRLPYPTGIIAILVFVPILLLHASFSLRSIGIAAAVLLLGITCFIDDRKQLHPALRLFVQLLCALLIFLTGDCLGNRICSITNPLEPWVGGPILELNGALPIASLIVTIFWLMLTTNALNWFDGIPGQTSALSTIAFLTIGLLALSDRVNQPSLALLSFALAGISASATLFEFPPPRVIPGDTGAMFFGLILGTLTIYAGGKVATAFLVLGVPLIDLAFVLVKRVTEGRSPLRGSAHGEHLHHRLLAKGWHPRTIILLSCLMGGSFGTAALFLNTLGKFLLALLLLLCMLLLWIYSSPQKNS